MSKPITFLQAYEEAQSVLPYQNTNDRAKFVKFLNRAVRRLISRAPMPSLVVRRDLLIDSDSVTEGAIILDMCEYESVLSIKKGCQVYKIMPASSLYLDCETGSSSFIDDGVNTTHGEFRYYTAPDSGHFPVGETVSCLVRLAYQEVELDGDYLPFDSVGAIKQAMIALFYEDQGDAGTASDYWQLAVNEATYEAREYRGSAYPIFSFRDPAFDSATKSVY